MQPMEVDKLQARGFRVQGFQRFRISAFQVGFRLYGFRVLGFPALGLRAHVWPFMSVVSVLDFWLGLGAQDEESAVGGLGFRAWV